MLAALFFTCALAVDSYNFVVNSPKSEFHLQAINVDSETGYLTTKNDTHLTIQFSGENAQVPGGPQALGLKDDSVLSLLDSINPNDVNYRLLDHVLLKEGRIADSDGKNGFVVCSDENGNGKFYYYNDTAPCDSFVSVEIFGLPLPL